MSTVMALELNNLRRALGAAYNQHVDQIHAAGASAPLRESCVAVGAVIADLLALASYHGVRDLSDEVTLRSPFGEDEQP